MKYSISRAHMVRDISDSSDTLNQIGLRVARQNCIFPGAMEHFEHATRRS